MTAKGQKRPSKPVRWICAACGEQFREWAPAERHGVQKGHGRLAATIEENPA